MAAPKIIYTFGIEETLTAIDGRNKHKLTSLTPYLSEGTMNKYRLLVEIKYLKQLSSYRVIRKFSDKEIKILDQIVSDFKPSDYREIREIELKTNHEQKAVEKFIQKKLEKTSLSDVLEMIHFGLTTDDVTNIVYGLMLKETLDNVLKIEINKLLEKLGENAKKYKSLPMLSRTHGQPAAPTTLGKEFLIYYKRLKEELEVLNSAKLSAKLSGNTGNLNAHKKLLPKINWLKFSSEFVKSFELEPDLVTTQIQPYDSYIRIFNSLGRINNILIGLCVDCWLYTSFGYFKLLNVKEEVGSTALPHKINPIYFEGAEGGFGIANALFEFYGRKLSMTRLQRDLSDSTVRRSISIALAYSFLSYQSVSEALKRTEANKDRISEDLQEHFEVLSEVIQNFLRLNGQKEAYDKTKYFFRGRKVTKEDLKKFIYDLNIEKQDKEYLLNLRVENYTGYASDLVDKYVK